MKAMFLPFFILLIIEIKSEWVSKEPKTYKMRLAHALRILDEVPLVDGHNDLASNIHDVLNNQLMMFPFDQNLTTLEPWASDKYSQTDLPRLIEGMIGAQIWSAWVPCASMKMMEDMQYAIKGFEQIDVIKRLINKYSDDLQLAVSTEDIFNAFSMNKIASLIGVEGGHMMNNSLAILRAFYGVGARYMTLTHTCNTAWAESSSDAEMSDMMGKTKGLTDFGKMVIGEMNRLGMIVDLSHTSDQTVDDVFSIAAAPVIFSHSGARALCDNPRNVPNDLLRKLKRNGGVVMVDFYPQFTTCSENATIYDVIDHINLIRNISGIDHVGIGSDFNGINRVPEGLEDVSKFPNIFAELLLDPTWTDEDLKKLAGFNFIRVFQLVESVKQVLHEELAIENMISDEMMDPME